MAISVLMQTTGPDSRLYVVVGILRNTSNQLLVQQRLEGKPCAGQWEFPGGKREQGETPAQTLTRELREELGITVMNITPLIQFGHDYAHGNVWLDVFLIDKHVGEITAMEDQNWCWKTREEIVKMDTLQAVTPILDAIDKLQ